MRHVSNWRMSSHYSGSVHISLARCWRRVTDAGTVSKSLLYKSQFSVETFALSSCSMPVCILHAESPQIGGKTLLWLFSCPVLFSSSNAQLEPCSRYSCFMAQMTWFRPRMVLFRLGWWVTFLGGNVPQKPPKGAWIGVFKPKSQNTKTCILSKLLHRFQQNFAQR